MHLTVQRTPDAQSLIDVVVCNIIKISTEKLEKCSLEYRAKFILSV